MSDLVYRGWIVANQSEAEHLESLGVILGSYNQIEGSYEDCVVSSEGMKNIDKFWGIYYWGLSAETEQ